MFKKCYIPKKISTLRLHHKNRLYLCTVFEAKNCFIIKI